jgi:hypothetical protein
MQRLLTAVPKIRGEPLTCVENERHMPLQYLQKIWLSTQSGQANKVGYEVYYIFLLSPHDF